MLGRFKSGIDSKKGSIRDFQVLDLRYRWLVSGIYTSIEDKSLPCDSSWQCVDQGPQAGQ